MLGERVKMSAKSSEGRDSMAPQSETALSGGRGADLPGDKPQFVFVADLLLFWDTQAKRKNRMEREK